jgi:hypothetical protein
MSESTANRKKDGGRDPEFTFLEDSVSWSEESMVSGKSSSLWTRRGRAAYLRWRLSLYLHLFTSVKRSLRVFRLFANTGEGSPGGNACRSIATLQSLDSQSLLVN